MDNGAILTAIIGASAATVGVVVAKDSKISEFRLQWIEALREDVAKLCSVSMTLYYNSVKYHLRDRLPDVVTPNSDQLVEDANNLGYRIRLRLDPKKPRTVELVRAMEKLVTISTFGQEPIGEAHEAVHAVLGITQTILNEAWITVKKGERRFRWTFWIALTVLVSTLLFALGRYTLHSFFHSL